MEAFFEENELEYEPECILRREVQSSGKSRAFINDTPASLTQMKELGEQLIDVHSQHQNLLLNKEGFQLNVLDILSHNEEALDVYHHLYQDWKKLCKELDELIVLAEQSKTDEDLLFVFSWNNWRRRILRPENRKSWNKRPRHWHTPKTSRPDCTGWANSCFR